MISRIETIGDLIEWLSCIATLKVKSVKVEGLSDSQVGNLISAQETLAEIKPKFPDPFKQCCKCRTIYPETKDWFDWSGQGRTGLHAECKFCRNSYQKKRKKSHRKSPYSPEDQEELKSHFGSEVVR